MWNMMKGERFEQGLAAAGLSVNDIDYVMCTHLHVDHVGWNTRLENGRWVPAFPKAKYLMADRELAFGRRRKKKIRRAVKTAARGRPIGNLPLERPAPS